METSGEWRVDRYVTSAGTTPLDRFLDALEARDREDVVKLLTHLRLRGNRLREPISRALGGGLHELRRRTIRIFYVFRPGHQIVVLDGIVKKQDRIPLDELRRIRSYQRDVEARGAP